MRILGLDPGLRHTGWGVVSRAKEGVQAEDWGVISPPAGLPVEKRLAVLADGLDTLFGTYTVHAISLEKTLVGKGATSALSLAFAQGVCLLLAERHGIPLDMHHPTHLKKALTGNGHATKDTMRFFVQETLALPHLNHHAADALALAFLSTTHTSLL
jgi:crossover junction endodeoxyribonuclease RuvC